MNTWQERARELEAELAAANQRAERAEAELEDCRERLDACQLRYIAATNPGIDMEDVKRVRAACNDTGSGSE